MSRGQLKFSTNTVIKFSTARNFQLILVRLIYIYQISNIMRLRPITVFPWTTCKIYCKAPRIILCGSLGAYTLLKCCDIMCVKQQGSMWLTIKLKFVVVYMLRAVSCIMFHLSLVNNEQTRACILVFPDLNTLLSRRCSRIKVKWWNFLNNKKVFFLL